MEADYSAMVADQNYSGTLKALDGAIEGARAEHELVLRKLVQLHVNRGLCNQRLQLNRKALKVGRRTRLRGRAIGAGGRGGGRDGALHSSCKEALWCVRTQQQLPIALESCVMGRI
jgi:hypothetical protein